MANLRTLGVRGGRLPTKKSATVIASDFLIGGILGKFERKYAAAFKVNNPNQFQEIFGSQIDPNFYGPDAVKGFFDNVAGVDASLYVVSHVGYDGAAIDGVVAYANLQDGTPATVIKLEAAYEDEPEYGISGNRTGYTVTLADRFATEAAATALATAYTITLDSVIGIKVGDIVKIVLTGGGGGTAYHTVTNVNESAKTITWTDSQLHASATLAVGDAVTVPGFRIRVWRKSLDGIVTEVDTELGKVICSTESAVSDYFVDNVFAQSKWVKATRQTTTPATLDLTFPAAVSTVTYLTSGADGTAPTTAAHWSASLALFDNLPVRVIANPETTTEAVQKAMETYAQARWDLPKTIFNVASNQTKAQLTVIGHSFQRSDDVLGVISAHWLKVSDPFSSSPLSPDREIPNVGHIMGLWLRCVGMKGIHYIAAQTDMPIYGVNGIVGDQFLDDTDRTDLAEAGVNVIQDVTGYGIILRNMFTPSTAVEFMYANATFMREYIMVSGVDSLKDGENKPNTFNRIKENRMALLSFYYQLWEKGSTGNVPTGETFGQSFNDDGSETSPEDHFEVQADLINNPQSKINIGEQNIDSWFTFPAPAGSIRINVGLKLR